jgi:hypothetical protein
MKLISCNNCAVVYDQDKMSFCHSDYAYDESGSIKSDQFTWDGDNFVPFVPCNVCKAQILKE